MSVTPSILTVKGVGDHEELEAQALRGYFDSMDLHMLWIMTRDHSRDS